MIRFAFPFVKLARTVCGLMVALCLAGALSDRRCGAFAAPFPAQKSNGKSADSSKSKSRSDSKAAAADADEDGDDPESITDPEAPRTEDSETSARVEKLLAESSTEDDFSDDQRFPPETGSFGDLSESKRQRYSETLRALLAEGLKPVTADARKSQVEAGRKRFESARQLCDDDPRLPYAYGLVFAAQSETDSAIGKFRESAKLAKLPHLAALSQVAILELTLGNRDAALDACREVAEGVLRPPDAWPGHDARVRIAEGLGQIVGYLDGESASVPRELAELRNSIETKFPADLKSAFQSTATAVSTRRRDLRDLAARSREEQSAESKRQSESAKRTMEETNEIRERIEKQLRDLTKPHQEDLKQVLGELRQRSAKLKSEELGARQFAAAVQNLSQPRLYPNNQVRVSRRGRASSSRSNAWRKENATERKQREQRLKAAKEKLESSLTQVRSLQQEVARGRSRRKELESQFTDSSRELKKELNAARLKHQAAEKELRDASAVEQNPEGTKQRADAPATYLAVDVKTLAEEVLASLDSAADHH